MMMIQAIAGSLSIDNGRLSAIIIPMMSYSKEVGNQRPPVIIHRGPLEATEQQQQQTKQRMKNPKIYTKTGDQGLIIFFFDKPWLIDDSRFLRRGSRARISFIDIR
jgi:hypothetical protein